MIDLAKAIRTKLLDHHPRVYLTNAPDDATFPYVVFHFPTGFSQGEMMIYNLDVDVWGKDPDTTEIDGIAHDIWLGLNRMRYLDDTGQFTVYWMNRLMLDDDEPQIQRRKLIFQVRYLDRRINDE